MALRLLLDENLSERLVLALAPEYFDTLHVRTLGLGGAADVFLWDIAAQQQCLLVTKDEDFVQLSVLRGPPPKVLWLNVGNAKTPAIAQLLKHNVAAIAEFERHPDAAFLALAFEARKPAR
jgi:predicted nuclease of predicted toxin-antitoxin system